MSAHLKSLTRRIKTPTLRAFPLAGSILLPGCEVPLNVFEPRYLNMVDDALKTDRLIAIVQPAHALNSGQGTPAKRSPSARPDLTPIGCVGRIKQFSETDDGRYMIALIGMKRFQITSEADVLTPYRQVNVSYSAYEHDADIHHAGVQSKALSEDACARAEMTAAMKNYARGINVEIDWDALSNIAMQRLVDQAAMISPFSAFDKQSLLEAEAGADRRKLLVGLMNLYSAGSDQDWPKRSNNTDKQSKDKLQ